MYFILFIAACFYDFFFSRMSRRLLEFALFLSLSILSKELTIRHLLLLLLDVSLLLFGRSYLAVWNYDSPASFLRCSYSNRYISNGSFRLFSRSNSIIDLNYEMNVNESLFVLKDTHT